VLTFSDDLSWCRRNLPLDDLVYVDASNADDPVNELLIMSACRHHIIANSTFSWWAAWLAHHRDQVVVAPEPWTSNAPTVSDLLPSHWTRLARC
jgi:Glycosyl transferase family 11